MSGASVAVDGNGGDMACDLLEMLGMNAICAFDISRDLTSLDYMFKADCFSKGE